MKVVYLTWKIWIQCFICISVCLFVFVRSVCVNVIPIKILILQSSLVNESCLSLFEMRCEWVRGRVWAGRVEREWGCMCGWECMCVFECVCGWGCGCVFRKPFHKNYFTISIGITLFKLCFLSWHHKLLTLKAKISVYKG